MSNLMSNSSTLQGKCNEFLHRCKTIHLKNARKSFFFDQKINCKEESTNRRNRGGVQRGRK